MTPMPPACAMAIASRASVTVSMAAEMIGRLRLIDARQPGGDVGLRRQHLGMAGLQQNVVESERFAPGDDVDDAGHAKPPK